MAAFPALHHVSITVSDFDRSVEWYRRLFASDPLMQGEEPAFAYALWLEPIFSIHRHTEPEGDEPFSERRTGLDHVSFGCADREEIEAWAAKLDELEIPHGGIVDVPYGSVLSFRDPDNIALEFFSMPS